jgi:hypothetical protein
LGAPFSFLAHPVGAASSNATSGPSDGRSGDWAEGAVIGLAFPSSA